MKSSLLNSKNWPLIAFGFSAVLLYFFVYPPYDLAYPTTLIPCPPRADPPSPPTLKIKPSSIDNPINVLITGGAGYIGSHFALSLLSRTDAVYSVTIIDDLSRGDERLIKSLKQNIPENRVVNFVHANIGDISLVSSVMKEKEIEFVVHFAGFAYASESVVEPLLYFENIVTNTAHLLEAMKLAKVKKLIFSSSSAVYGKILREDCDVPLSELSPLNPSSPYGRSKLMAEQVVRAYYESRLAANDDFSFVALRYFNVIGADSKTRLGALPKRNLAKYGRLVDACFDSAESGTPMNLYGDDYSTFDGSPIRDYIHVSDLVDAHILLMDAVHDRNALTYNVGIGKGFSVNQVVESCKRVTGIDIKVNISPRRPGDPPLVMGDASLIKEHFNWKPTFTDLNEMIQTAWNWRQKSKNL